MREFKHPNITGGFECPICKTGKDEPVVLVPIQDTQDGNICEAKQVHSDCYKVVMKMHGEEMTIE